MRAWRTLASVVMLLAAGAGAGAQTYPLSEDVKAGDCCRVQLVLNLNGQLRVNRDGKVQTLPLSAVAGHEFAERVLHVGVTGLAEKAARVYETARAQFRVGDGTSERTLRSERRLIVAQRHRDQPLVYSPAGPLTREELGLTGEHFDTLALAGLLPGKAIAVGDTWKVANAVAQALCHFEGLVEHDLAGRLDDVTGTVARGTVAGAAKGIDAGAMAQLKIQAAFQFDLTARRLVWVEWKQTDERAQGPVSPSLTAQLTATVRRTPVEQPAVLSDVALVPVPDGFEPPAPLTHLAYRDPKGRFEMTCGRDWHIVSQSDEHLVMRLMDRGDFVAQATFTPWMRAAKGNHLTPDELRQTANRTPNWEPENELQAGEVPSEGGRWAYRVSTLGSLDGQKVVQNFYALASPEGEQLLVLFTMTPKQADRLGSRDLSIVGSIELPTRK